MNTPPSTVEVFVQERNAPSPFVWIGVVALVYLLLVGVATIGAGFKTLSGGADGAAAIFAFASNPVVGVILGTLATALVQSSSTVTSVIVGLVAGGVPVGIAVPMIMGANIGTCVTALLAATFITGPNEFFALQIALVHLLYNVFGVLLFMAIPFLRELPVRSAQWLGARVESNRSWAFGYIGAVFFVVPGVVFGAEMLFSDDEVPLAATCDQPAQACARDEVQQVAMRLE